MTALVLVARYILVVLFAVAAATKLVAPDRWRGTVEGLGPPRRLLGPLAAAIPLAELTIALLLAFDATVNAGAIAAIALLGAFIATIAIAVARGHRPDCNCFGKTGSSELGWATVGRNSVFIALAALVLWNPSLVPSSEVLIAAAAALIIGAQAWFGLQLLRQNGRVLARLATLEGHSAVPVETLAAEPPTTVRAAAPAAAGAVAAGALVLATPAFARRDAETDQIKATLNVASPIAAADRDAVAKGLIKVAESKQRRPSLRGIHLALADQGAHYAELRAQLVALTATSAEAQAARDAAVASVDYTILASEEFDRMIEIKGKRKRKRSRNKATKLLEQAAAAGYYANVGIGCPGKGC